ncbi:diguanylate cyclase [Shewanella sp.]|uniref:diguanylate cyclase n=1 Tax=Shewanella sp. TaxID=50422 RepID=UPI004053F9CB
MQRVVVIISMLCWCLLAMNAPVFAEEEQAAIKDTPQDDVIQQIISHSATLSDAKQRLSYLKTQALVAQSLPLLKQAQWLHLLAIEQEALGKLDGAAASYTQAIHMLEPLPLSALLVNSYLERSYIVYLNSNDASLYCQDRNIALTHARKLNDPELLVKALSLNAFCFNNAQNFNVGLMLLDEALDIARANQLSNNRQAMIYNASATLYRDNGLHRRALTFYKQAFELWQQVDDTQDMFNMLHNLIGESVNLSLWQEADGYLAQMKTLVVEKSNLKDFKFKDFEFFYQYNLGQRWLFSYDFIEAIVHLKQAIALENSTSEAYFVHTSYAFLAIAYLQLGDKKQAIHWAKRFNDVSQGAHSKKDLQMAIEAIGLLGEGKTIDAVNLLLKTINDERTKFADFINNGIIYSALEHNSKVAEHQNRLLENQLEIKRLALNAQHDEQQITRLTLWLTLLLVLVLLSLMAFLYQSRRHFKHRSQTDYLTGIASRSYTMEEGETLHSHSRKQGQTLAVIMFDIDNFKRINDSHGHDIGDMAIRAVAQRAKHFLKQQDILGRVGGEEFLLILPNSQKQDAILIAERLRASIDDKIFNFKGIELRFSISVGVALSHPEQSFNNQVKSADLALYQAKNAGRNCVSFC